MDEKIDKILKIYTWAGIAVYTIVFISTLFDFI